MLEQLPDYEVVREPKQARETQEQDDHYEKMLEAFPWLAEWDATHGHTSRKARRDRAEVGEEGATQGGEDIDIEDGLSG